MAAPRRSARPTSAAAEPPSPAFRLGLLAVWLVVLVPPFLLSLSAKESFRLPKLMASEWLALASLALFSWRVRTVAEVRRADLWRQPAVRALTPLLVLATVSLGTTAHPIHVREGLIDLWIGAAALTGWSLALPERRQEELLRGLLWPATALAVFGILQFHGLFQPLRLVGIGYDRRLAITSTAGNPGDLGAYLVLPCLLAQWLLAQWLLARRPGSRPESRPGRGRWAALAPVLALVISLYALALTQTLAALAALAVGSLLLWAGLLPARRVATALAAGVALLLVLLLAVAPLRTRLTAKLGQARHADWNSVLTGRLDGWRAALWMLREHPWTGVGHGAYRPEFVPAKIALLDRGASFYARQVQPVFANAHNEYLEVGADGGIPALLALGWALWTLGATLRSRPAGARRALAMAGTAALAVLAVAYFPFRIALVAYPALLFLAWVLRPGGEGDESGKGREPA